MEALRVIETSLSRCVDEIREELADITRANEVLRRAGKEAEGEYDALLEEHLRYKSDVSEESLLACHVRVKELEAEASSWSQAASATADETLRRQLVDAASEEVDEGS